MIALFGAYAKLFPDPCFHLQDRALARKGILAFDTLLEFIESVQSGC